MIDDTSMLKIVFSSKGHRSLNQKWTGQTYNESYSRLYYIISGQADMWHHGQHFRLNPGYLYLIPPQSNLEYRCRRSMEVAWVHFNISLYGYLDIFDIHDFDFFYIPETSEHRHDQMLSLVSSIDRKDMFGQLRAKSILLDIVACFFKFQRYSEVCYDRDKREDFMPVLEYIDKHLGERIRLADLAEIAAYEKTYFSTLFKRIFSISPFQYIQEKRIEKAQSMLRNTDAKLSVIADELGFNDAFHLSKTFKKMTGESPSDFRERIPRQMP